MIPKLPKKETLFFEYGDEIDYLRLCVEHYKAVVVEQEKLLAQYRHTANNNTRGGIDNEHDRLVLEIKTAGMK